MANYTVINGSNSNYSNINAGGTDVGAMTYRDAVALSDAELAVLLDGSTFPNAAALPDQAAVTPTAAATQRKREIAIASLYLNPLA